MKNWKTLLSVIISILFITYIYVNRKTIFGALADIKPLYIVIVFIGQIGVQLSNAALLRVTLKPLGKNMSQMEATKLTTVSSFVNFFTPVVGGVGLRALYLKSRHQLAYSSFAGVTYANYLIIFIVSFLAGLLALLNLDGLNWPVGQTVALFFLGGILFSVGFMAFGHHLTRMFIKHQIKKQKLAGLVDKVKLVDEGWEKIRTDKSTMWQMAFWSAATMFSVTVVYWASMLSIGLDVSISVAILFAALAIVGLLFNITPGSIGIREAVYFAVSVITGVSAQQVVAFSLIDRSAQLLTLGAGWLLFNKSIINNIDRKKLNR